MAKTWSCRCLNIKINEKPTATPNRPFDLSLDEGYIWAHVGSKGLQIVSDSDERRLARRETMTTTLSLHKVHEQLTSKTRKIVSVPSSSAPTVQTTLQCLVCGRTVCRAVSQIPDQDDNQKGTPRDNGSSASVHPFYASEWLQVSERDCLVTCTPRQAMPRSLP